MISRHMSITRDEIPKIEAALRDWFSSQNLTPHDAAIVMAHMAAIIVGTDSNDDDHMHEGLQALSVTMRDAAAEARGRKKRPESKK